MSIREEQCRKVCRILDDILANRPTERDALCVAVNKAFETLSHGKQRTGHWIPVGMVEAVGGESAQWGSAVAYHKCSECDEQALRDDFEQEVLSKWCPHCGVKMEGANNDT